MHHKALPGIDHMAILRDEGAAATVATLIDNINKQLYEEEKYFDRQIYPKVEVIL